jgi:hypothetical protein
VWKNKKFTLANRIKLKISVILRSDFEKSIENGLWSEKKHSESWTMFVFCVLAHPMRRIKIKEGGDSHIKKVSIKIYLGTKSYAQYTKKSFREPVPLRVSGEISLPSIILVWKMQSRAVRRLDTPWAHSRREVGGGGGGAITLLDMLYTVPPVCGLNLIPTHPHSWGGPGRGRGRK